MRPSAALIAAATAGKAPVDDDCAKRAAAELTRDRFWLRPTHPNREMTGMTAIASQSPHCRARFLTGGLITRVSKPNLGKL
jgi:hypothetical protein